MGLLDLFAAEVPQRLGVPKGLGFSLACVRCRCPGSHSPGRGGVVTLSPSVSAVKGGNGAVEAAAPYLDGLLIPFGGQVDMEVDVLRRDHRGHPAAVTVSAVVIG